MDTYLTSKDAMEPVPNDELMQRIKRGDVTILDVRPPDEYAAGHLPGAINVPLNKLTEQLPQLKSNQEIVAYCRGPYCVLSYDAVALLRKNGLKARRMEKGYPEWKLAGFPLDV